jgi:hypothetical protein
MLFLSIPDGLDETQKAAFLAATKTRVDAAINAVFAGMAPIDEEIARAIVNASNAFENPSFDGRLGMLTDAFQALLGALMILRPEGKELWVKKAAEYRAAFDKVCADIQGEQAAKLN